MRENKKRVIITLLIIVSMITIFFTFKTFINKPLKELPEVKLSKSIGKNVFAIMVEDDNGDGYQEYEGEEWPKEVYSFSKAECLDNSGNKIENAINFDANQILQR